MLRVSLAPPILFVSLAVVACRSSLGLSDLKFEARPTKIAESPGSNEGGAGGSAEPFFESFPIQVPNRFEVFPSTLGPDFARFFLYDATTGDLERYHGTNSQLSSDTLSFVPNQTFIAESSTSDEAALFGYASETGLVSLAYDLREDAALVVETTAGSPGYTSVVSFNWPNFAAPKLFVHNEKTGAFRYVPMPGNQGDETAPIVGTLPLVGVTFSAWPDPSIPRVLAFDPVDNDVSLWTLGETCTREGTFPLSNPTTAAFAILDATDEIGLVSYDANSGKAERFALALEGDKLIGTPEASANLPAAFENFFLIPNEKAFLAFNDETRVLDLYTFDPLHGSGPVIVK